MPAIDKREIRNLLSRLKQSGKSVFGSDAHRYLLNDPLLETEVSEFERRYQISLPSDYRQFISEVGNGGAGPFYGIFPLGFVDHNFGIQEWKKGDGLVGNLSMPFAHTTTWNDLSALPPDGLRDSDMDEYDRRMEKLDNVYWAPALINGAIPICHQGCALRVYLVVTGEEAGHLWEDRRSEYAGIKPMLREGGSSLTFSRWYQQWLEQADASLS